MSREIQMASGRAELPSPRRGTNDWLTKLRSSILAWFQSPNGRHQVARSATPADSLQTPGPDTTDEGNVAVPLPVSKKEALSEKTAFERTPFTFPHASRPMHSVLGMKNAVTSRDRWTDSRSRHQPVDEVRRRNETAAAPAKCESSSAGRLLRNQKVSFDDRVRTSIGDLHHDRDGRFVANQPASASWRSEPTRFGAMLSTAAGQEPDEQVSTNSGTNGRIARSAEELVHSLQINVSRDPQTASGVPGAGSAPSNSLDADGVPGLADLSGSRLPEDGNQNESVIDSGRKSFPMPDVNPLFGDASSDLETKQDARRNVRRRAMLPPIQ